MPGACRCLATGHAARHPGRGLTIVGLNPRECTPQLRLTAYNRDRLRLVRRAWWRWHLNLSRRWARIKAIRCCPSYITVTELGHHKNAQLIDLVPQRIKIRFDLDEISLNLTTSNAP